MMSEAINIDDAVEDILDEFDFEKVKKVMDFLDWKWHAAEDGVPRIAELRKSARSLLKQCAFKVLLSSEIDAESNIFTGGFRAQAYKYDDNVNFRLSFVLTEWDDFE
jgi:hypothetical protein